MKLFKQLAVAFAATLAFAAQADINVGVTLSATGPAASLGIPEKNTFALMPPTRRPPLPTPASSSPRTRLTSSSARP
jgi:hypothetical protein